MSTPISISLPERPQDIKKFLPLKKRGRPGASKDPAIIALEDIAKLVKPRPCSARSVADFLNGKAANTLLPQQIREAIIQLINKRPDLKLRLLNLESAARIKRTKK